MRIIRYTGFKTPTEYFKETTPLDRVFFQEAVQEYERKRAERDAELMGSLFQ